MKYKFIKQFSNIPEGLTFELEKQDGKVRICFNKSFISLDSLKGNFLKNYNETQKTLIHLIRFRMLYDTFYNLQLEYLEEV